MQVLVRKSNVSPDCECGICGQGFRLYWERGSAEMTARAGAEIRDAIHAQHLHSPGRAAHPEVPFTVPKWPGLPQFSDFPARPGATPERGRTAFTKARAS